MPSSLLTELALRAAVNTTKPNFSSEHPADDIKKVALDRGSELIRGNTTDSAMAGQINVQGLAIALAVQGLELAYFAVQRQLDLLKHQRLAFDKERQAGIATFIVPTNVEERDLSKEERIIKQFVSLSQRSSFSTYLAIHDAELLEEHHAKFYSVLPFYRMSDALLQPVASTRPLDKQRIAIGLFFKSALPEAIADIDIDFQLDNKFIAFFKSAFQKGNYLNDRRAPRFIMMSLANLLWNLQHPVDPISGFPLSLDKCMVLCRDVELFLNRLLNSEAAPYLQEISNDDNQLISFVRKVEIHTKILRAAYAEEQLHELNIADVTNSAHHVIRLMDKSVFKLIYKRHNPITRKNEPDEKAAEDMAYTVSYLNQLLIRNPDLMAVFQAFESFVPTGVGMNTPPTTVIDLLILFCHLSWRERHDLLHNLEHTRVDSALEMAKTLRQFNIKFVKPIREFSKKELHATCTHPKHSEVATLTARRLLPFITLVIEDYRVEVDTEQSYQIAKESLEKEAQSRIYTGKEQVQAINKQAESEKEDGYYVWALSPFVELRPDTEAELDKLPKHQYRMTQITKLLDCVREIVENYRSFLQHKAFQDFLIKCLDRVKGEYTRLEDHIGEVDKCLANDESMSRSMQAILRPMASDLNAGLESFLAATKNFERVVSAPDFTAQQRTLLSSKIDSIHKQFSELFGEESSITDLVDIVPVIQDDQEPVVLSRPTLTDKVSTKQSIALHKLVERCYHALSYQSKQGRKGLLLKDLLCLIDRKSSFSPPEIKHAVMELVRLTASYRETWFFQAAYAHTRSAKALIAAIKDPDVNAVLPLAKIIFGQETNYLKITDAQIMDRLTGLRGDHHWKESINQIQQVEFRMA